MNKTVQKITLSLLAILKFNVPFDSISFMFKFNFVVKLRRKILFVTNPFITFTVQVYETVSCKLSVLFPCS